MTKEKLVELIEKNNRKELLPGNEDIIFPAAEGIDKLPKWYPDFFKEIKTVVSESRRNTMILANTSMMMTYYRVGKMILKKQEEEGWGAKVIDRLSYDLKEAFPEQKGFSPRNLKYMRKFAQIWSDEQIVQRTVAQLSWRHNIYLMEKCQEDNRRLAYAIASIENGWSHNMLSIHLEAHTLERSGKLPNNFSKTLPSVDSDMVQYLFKDPYLLDFTGADKNSREKEIEDALTTQITKFLLELGQGFSFVGRQVHLELGGDDFYIDMLFYHLKLRCFVVIELKATKFEPGMMSQLGMYQTIVDRTMKHPSDNPTIGLLLVKSKNETVVKYSIENQNQPVGVASWETELTQKMLEEWKSSLPTIEEIERELEDKGGTK